ncbi:Vsp/OspC family lipoprotein (plasmid) [Borrelia puertoricensis]|uniref:Vsp/OspC family lipoprotein n=1 Tax=Borrelia puertoricensis TaxID=2756107 RepID=UPI003EB9FE00
MKRITLCALFLTLFLLSSCNTSGAATKDGQAAKSDGTLIDLVTITKNIKDSVAFAKSVKEIHTLVKSIDELAKAIGKKIKNGDELDIEAAVNESLVAGAFQVILTVETKLKLLEEGPSAKISDECKKKVTEAKTKSREFLGKLRGTTATLGKKGVADNDAKAAIDRIGTSNGDKGVAELKKLNTSIDELLTSAEAAVTAAIAELTTSTKPSN